LRKDFSGDGASELGLEKADFFLFFLSFFFLIKAKLVQLFRKRAQSTLDIKWRESFGAN
jgi:hypothetical protein